MDIEKFHTNGLGYYCNQRIEDFNKSEEGLYCNQCHKHIIDFREKTKSEYLSIVNNNPKVCGIFYSNQIENEIEIAMNWKKPVMVFSFFIAFLFSKTAAAQNSPSAKVELSDSSKTTKTDTALTSQKKARQLKTDKKETAAVEKNLKVKRKKKLYLSGSFPFIHYGRGRLRLGMTSDYW